MSKIKEYLTNFGYASKIIFAASKKYFIIKWFLALVSSVIPYLPLLLWRELINSLVDAVGANNETLLHKIWLLATLYCVVMLVQKLLLTVSEFVSFKYNDAIEYYLENVMIDKVSTIDLAFFDSSELNDKLKNSWSLIRSTKEMVTFVFDIIQISIRLVISFLLMLTLSLWIIPVVIVLCIPSIIGDKKIKDMEYRFKKEHTISHRKLEYYKGLFFGGARSEIRLYNLCDYFSLLYENVWRKWDNVVHAKNIKICLINIASLFLLTINEVIVYVLSIAKLIAGEIAVGEVAYYVSILNQFRGDFTSLCFRINMFDKNSKELNDVRTFVEMEPLLEKCGTLIPSKYPTIEFKDVSFRYPNSNYDVLKHCSFTINAGETVGLVGLNGSGKSTIVKLLCRFYDPTGGKILIDGIDAKEYDIVELRRLFGVLFQDYIQYSFSFRENVALSDLSRINDTEAICEACKQSKTESYVKEWKNGIDENLTRRFDPKGKELSRGQWQRIALARAFFRNAPVILLDEPSAALDPVAEHEIFEDFSNISKSKSALLISHRLSSITLCDRILVLENGNIIEQGTHSDLIKLGGRYSYLFNIQASKYI